MIALSQRIAHERLTRICYVDYDREIALVAEQKDAAGERNILAVGRLTKEPATDEAQFAILVADPVQGRGLGSELLKRLIEIGRKENVRRITAEILQDNYAMQKVCERLGFRLERDAAEGVVKARIEL
jgi:acetyltransferase